MQDFFYFYKDKKQKQKQQQQQIFKMYRKKGCDGEKEFLYTFMRTGIFLFLSLTYLNHLEDCVVHARCSVNICGTNECFACDN